MTHLTKGLAVIHHSQLYEGTELKHATPLRADTHTQLQVVYKDLPAILHSQTS